MCPREIRSFAPAIREYDSAVLLSVALPAATTAPFCKNSLRLILLSDWSEENPMSRSESKINRREFLQKRAVVAAGRTTSYDIKILPVNQARSTFISATTGESQRDC